MSHALDRSTGQYTELMSMTKLDLAKALTYERERVSDLRNEVERSLDREWKLQKQLDAMKAESTTTTEKR